jgi:hypothetical protein
MAIRPTVFTLSDAGLISPDGGNVVLNPNLTIDGTATFIDGGVSGGGGASVRPTVIDEPITKYIGGGGIVVNDTPKNPIKPQTETIPGLTFYTIRIDSNIKDAGVFVNGQQSSKVTPSTLVVYKKDLLKGPQTITISKEGYVSNEKFVVTLLSKENTIVIDNPKFDVPLGLDNTYLDVKYFVNDVEEFYDERKNSSGGFYNFTYTLSKPLNPTKDPILYNFVVRLTGNPNSVLINKNGLSEFYPIEGINRYEDLEDTTFYIKSGNPSVYRISEIVVSSDGNGTPKVLTAEKNESLSINLNLKNNYDISIRTEEVPAAVTGLDPQISLLKSDARTYNINSKLGVPIVFQKNKDVVAVTVVVGDTVLEYTDLDEGDIAGITIPHSAFSTIGKFNVKIYPFSLKDYEQQVRPAQPPIKVTTRTETIIQTPKVEVTEVITPVRPNPVKTAYELPILPTIPASPIVPIKPTLDAVEPTLTIKSPTAETSVVTSGGGGGSVSIVEARGNEFDTTNQLTRIFERVSGNAIR